MRKLIVSNFITLDGFMAGTNRDLDWFMANEEFFKHAVDLLHAVDTILLGRVTYQEMVGYWITTQPDDPIGSKMNSLPKVVASKTLDSTPWGTWDNATLIKGDAVEGVKRLKQQPGGDIVIYGSGELVGALTNAGLIDEYQLIVSPVVLGKGMPFFKDIAQRTVLSLIRSETFSNGVMILYYAPQK